jgi:hypothetical protein
MNNFQNMQTRPLPALSLLNAPDYDWGMSIPVNVVGYSAWKANERPLSPCGIWIFRPNECLERVQFVGVSGRIRSLLFGRELTRRFLPYSGALLLAGFAPGPLKNATLSPKNAANRIQCAIDPYSEEERNKRELYPIGAGTIRKHHCADNIANKQSNDN